MNASPKILLTVLLAAALAGCGGSVVESKKVDYKSTGKLPPLDVPPDLTQPTRDDRYAVPDSGAKGSATFSTYAGERTGQAKAAPSDVLPQVDKMRIERSGNQRWLVVAGIPTEKLWPVVKEFWQEIGFIVNVELPEAGVMETDWAENRAKLPHDVVRSTLGKVFDSLYSTAERDKFRTRLEKSSEAGSTEIYVSHRGMYEVYVTEGKDQTRWQPRPPDPDLEAEMLRRLMVRLGAPEGQAKTQVAATATLKEERAKLVQATDGSGTLQLQETFDRAWRRVGLALDRVGFTVEDRDRSQGLYFVRYVDPEPGAKKDDKGFLSKLMFWRSDAKVNPEARYRIHVKGDGADSTVQVMTREGSVDKSETAKKILGLLHEQLK